MERRPMKAIEKVIVLGGGTAGWMAAASLARVFRRHLEVTLIESADVPIVGVGEATIPPILDFLRFLGVDEQAFIAATNATYKLGIVFQDWLHADHRYWHPFGTFGGQINGRPFHHYWHRANRAGCAVTVEAYSLAAALGEQAKYLAPSGTNDPLRAGLRYALHFDAVLVGKFLRTVAERAGVRRIEATVAGSTRSENGHIRELVLTDGRRIDADLFIDCTGFRATLIGDAMGVPFHDWQHWLPCDRAVAMPSPTLHPLPSYTLAAAHQAGWRWQIPLQNRTGNGLVYSSRWMADDDAMRQLQREIGDCGSAEPRQLRFTAGRREVFWRGNCVALGLASGFLEPLESTSIQLALNAIYKLLDHFPDKDFAPENIGAFNTYLIEEFDAVRDFIILHYWPTQRRDSPFWRYSAAMDLPDSLLQRIELYKSSARIVPRPFEIFTDLSWFYIYEGMGLRPRASDPIAELPSTRDLLGVMQHLRNGIASIVRQAPDHDRFFNTAREAVA
jgi:tryptophan halogenase